MHETGVLDPTSKNKECMNVYMRLFYQINLGNCTYGFKKFKLILLYTVYSQKLKKNKKNYGANVYWPVCPKS